MKRRPVISKLVEDISIPPMFTVRQIFERESLPADGIPSLLLGQLEDQGIADRVRPGMRVAVAAGSRGVANVAAMVRTTVDFIRARGATPFIVPSMGSHGGATAEGQRGILATLGITEATMGCPVVSSMEVKCIGVNDEGKDVLIDRHAAEADGIVIVCRIKPHTAFRAPYESGMMKMLAIGLSKQAGAERTHFEGIHNMGKNVHLFGRAILRHAPVLFAVATVENAYDETARLLVVPAEEIEAREPDLLKDAFARMGRIWVDSCDVLVVDQIGKNFSGDGMDPNVTGTFYSDCTGGIASQKVAVLDLTDESHGNGVGVGVCHAIPQALYEKLDLEALYVNCITGTVLHCARIPMIMENHKECIQVCLRSCVENDKERPRLVRIPNSLHLERIMLSEAYWDEARAHPNLVVESEPAPLSFDGVGNLF